MDPSATKRTLSNLPYELQLAILCHIPPNQLFVLRRVSHSWNNFLRNQNLLDDINATLPFLTSAPDLTSRMKRRMRMVREEPVWVKSFDDAFPWASPYRKYMHAREWERFSDGWLVFLTGDLDNVEWTSETRRVITLTIGGFHPKGMVKVDTFAALRAANPEVCRAWSEDDILEPNGHKTFRDITRFHLNVEQGMALVGLQGKEWNARPSDLQDIAQYSWLLKSIVERRSEVIGT